MCTYNDAVFEWDKNKAKRNLVKRRIAFADTSGAFDDPNALTVEDHTPGEQRFITIGMDGFGRMLVVVYTWRGHSVRIISAGKATRVEMRQYESEL